MGKCDAHTAVACQQSSARNITHYIRRQCPLTTTHVRWLGGRQTKSTIQTLHVWPGSYWQCLQRQSPARDYSRRLAKSQQRSAIVLTPPKLTNYFFQCCEARALRHSLSRVFSMSCNSRLLAPPLFVLGRQTMNLCCSQTNTCTHIFFRQVRLTS